MNLERDSDPVNRTSDARELCFDIVNLSASTLIFRDFSKERNFAREHGDISKLQNFPPLELAVPPRHMATIPDEYYQGKTADGRAVTEVFKFFGPERPTRKTKRRFSRRVLIETAMAPIWGAIPVSELALAQVELLKAKK